MSKSQRYIEEGMKSYKKIHEIIFDFANKYKDASEMPSFKVRNIFIEILDEIDVMKDSSKNLFLLLKDAESIQEWQMSLEDFNYYSDKNN